MRRVDQAGGAAEDASLTLKVRTGNFSESVVKRRCCTQVRITEGLEKKVRCHLNRERKDGGQTGSHLSLRNRWVLCFLRILSRV